MALQASIRFAQRSVAFVTVALVYLAAAAAVQAEVRTIDWNDLVPKLPPLVDPLDALKFEERFELESILWVRQLTEVEKQERADIVEEAARYERGFAQRGVSIDKLIAEYAAWSKEAEARQRLMNEELNGKKVQLQGYLLPIEFSDDGVTDFLVVPYVGACIHVPAPPANQIVFAQLPRKLRIDDLFTAAKITGTLRTKLDSKQLNLSDGSAPVAVGYHLGVERFEIVQN